VLIPKYAAQLPEPVAETVGRAELPRQEIDVAALDGGLGIGLAVGGDYLNLVGATRDWGIEWKLVELGGGNTRLSAPGLTAYAARGKLTGYVLDLKVVFAEERWAPWRKALTGAGLSPELNWRTATGEAQMPQGTTEHVLTGRGGQEFAGENANTSYTLYFRDGWLKRVEAGRSTGEPVPDPIFEPPAEDEKTAPVLPPVDIPPPPATVPPATAG
jgi:hypothetical protein